MARLYDGERDERRQSIFRLLQRHRWGLKEVEVAQEMGMSRRVANNYLRELRTAQKAEKEGRLWFSKR